MPQDTWLLNLTLVRRAIRRFQSLEAALRRHLRGEIRFDCRQPRTLCHRRLQLPPGSDRASYFLATRKMFLQRLRSVPRTSRAAPRPGWGDFPRRTMLQRCRRARLSRSTWRAILEIDPVRRIARVEPGVVLDTLRAAAEKHHLTFAPDPATHDRCTLGGMIGNNSCGVHSIMAGKTDDNIDSLESPHLWRAASCDVGATERRRLRSRSFGRVDGRAEIYSGLKSLGRPLRRPSAAPVSEHPAPGFRIQPQPIAAGKRFSCSRVRWSGTEGTCATILEATCRLVESPPARVLLVIGWPDVFICADHVPADHGAPSDRSRRYLTRSWSNASRHKGVNLEGLALLPEGAGWLMVEFGAATDCRSRIRRRAI
jgi:hypothetical protein